MFEAQKSFVGFETLEGRRLLAGIPLTITTAAIEGGTELRITGSAGNDQINVSQTSGGLLITNTGGWSSLQAGTFQSIRIDAGAGNDVIAVNANVMINCVLYGGAGNDTITGGSGNDRLYGGIGSNRLNGGSGDDVLVSIGGGSNDTLTGGSGTDSFWADSAKTESISDASTTENASGRVHRVGGFYTYKINGKATTVAKDLLGQKLAEPVTTSTSITYRNFASKPLFSAAGPVADDVAQGYVGDCYYLATLSSIAKTNPNLIRQSVVDLGDGTYAVQFGSGSVKTFVRVDGDLPTWSNGSLAYADYGQGHSIWVGVMEKAWAFYRSGKGTYNSISGGWMSEVYSALGKSSTWMSTSIQNATALLQWVNTQLTAGKSVTAGVFNVPQGTPLIGSHAYSIDSVLTDDQGNLTGLRVRNPWAVDGAGNDGLDDGYVTITGDQAWACMKDIISSAV